MLKIRNRAQQVIWPIHYSIMVNCFIIVGLVALIFTLSTVSSLAQGQIWEKDKLIGLSAGTCIREGPGFTYRAHTRVPENDWTVMIIDGPRVADGRT